MLYSPTRVSKPADRNMRHPNRSLWVSLSSLETCDPNRSMELRIVVMFISISSTRVPGWTQLVADIEPSEWFTLIITSVELISCVISFRSASFWLQASKSVPRGCKFPSRGNPMQETSWCFASETYCSHWNKIQLDRVPQCEWVKSCLKVHFGSWLRINFVDTIARCFGYRSHANLLQFRLEGLIPGKPADMCVHAWKAQCESNTCICPSGMVALHAMLLSSVATYLNPQNTLLRLWALLDCVWRTSAYYRAW